MTTAARQTESEAQPERELKDDEVEVEEPLADLSTLEPDRPKIRIRSSEHPDGKLYELADINDFGVLEQHALKRDGAKYDKLWRKETLRAAEKEELQRLLEKLFDQVLLAPPELKAQLSDGQRSQVVVLFTNAPAIRAMARIRREQAEEARDGSTTAS